MSTTAIDTLRYARRLKAAGVPDHQAEEMDDALGNELVDGKGRKYLTGDEREPHAGEVERAQQLTAPDPATAPAPSKGRERGAASTSARVRARIRSGGEAQWAGPRTPPPRARAP